MSNSEWAASGHAYYYREECIELKRGTIYEGLLIEEVSILSIGARCIAYERWKGTEPIVNRGGQSPYTLKERKSGLHREKRGSMEKRAGQRAVSAYKRRRVRERGRPFSELGMLLNANWCFSST